MGKKPMKLLHVNLKSQTAFLNQINVGWKRLIYRRVNYTMSRLIKSLHQSNKCKDSLNPFLFLQLSEKDSNKLIPAFSFRISCFSINQLSVLHAIR